MIDLEVSDDIFDEKVNIKSYFYLIFLFCMIVLLIGLLFIRKDFLISGNIIFNDKQNVVIQISESYINKLDKTKIEIEGIKYTYNINKISKSDINNKIYFLEITLNESVVYEANKYFISLGNESIISYLIRIIRSNYE